MSRKTRKPNMHKRRTRIQIAKRTERLSVMPVKALRQLATAHELPGRSKMDRDSLVAVLATCKI